jgi:hypothetical protein
VNGAEKIGGGKFTFDVNGAEKNLGCVFRVFIVNTSCEIFGMVVLDTRALTVPCPMSATLRAK